MGNNFAKTVRCEVDPTILPPPPPLSAPSTGAPPPPGEVPGGPPVNERFKNNPGTMDDFHKKCKGKTVGTNTYNFKYVRAVDPCSCLLNHNNLIFSCFRNITNAY
jgi:hypothetical protein